MFVLDRMTVIEHKPSLPFCDSYCTDPHLYFGSRGLAGWKGSQGGRVTRAGQKGAEEREITFHFSLFAAPRYRASNSSK